MIKYLLTKCMIYMYLYKVAIVARIITKSFNFIFIIKHSFITICQCSFICIIVVHVNVYNYFDYFIKVSDFLQLHVLYIIIHIWTVYQSLWSEQQYAIIKNYKIRYNKPTNTRETKLWIFFIAFFFLHLTSACVTMATAPESNIGTGSRSDRFTDTWDKKGLKLLWKLG